jgi:hypothetical protein
LEAGPAHDDPRAQGFTFVSKTIFKDMVDHDYYDKHCGAHKILKENVVSTGVKVDGLMTIFYQPTVVSRI